MKKILICIGFFFSLYGAEDCTLQMRASNLYSSVQTKWPLNTPLTIAACGALALYAGYKACISRVPQLPVPNAGHISSEETMHTVKEEEGSFKPQNSGVVLCAIVLKKQKPGATESKYSYVVSQGKKEPFDPLCFFASSEYLANKYECNKICVKFVTENDDLLMFLSCRKEGDSLKSLSVFNYTDWRADDNRYKPLNPPSILCLQWCLNKKEIFEVNQKYIEKSSVKAGETLHIPQSKPTPSVQPEKSSYAWYNPWRWLRVLLRYNA